MDPAPTCARHVDDFLAASRTAHKIMEEMKRIHTVSGAGPPERHLGADVCQVNEDKLREMWFIRSKSCVNEAVNKVERPLGETMKLSKNAYEHGNPTRNG